MMRYAAKICFGVLLLPLAASAGSTITISPVGATVVATQTQDFVAVVTGTTNKNVQWKVCNGIGQNCVLGGNSSLGTIADTGLTDAEGNHIGRYTAPAGAPTSCTPVTGGCQVRVRANLTGSPRRRKKKAFADATISPLAFVLERVSVATDGTEGNHTSGYPSVSADGRFVAFGSYASNLVPGDTNGAADVFVRDTCLDADPTCVPSTALVSVASDGTQGNAMSDYPSISADGRFVAFYSQASDLVPDDTNPFSDIFVRDTCQGADPSCVPSTALVSVASDGTHANHSSSGASISADGRFVAFESSATNLVPGDTNGIMNDVFVRDTCVGATDCVPSTLRASLSSDGTQVDNFTWAASISANGRIVVFKSYANNLVPDDTNDSTDVFVRDTCQGAAFGCTPSTLRVSVADDGAQGNSYSYSWAGSLSADGRFVAFDSYSRNLVPGDTNVTRDVFVRDTCLGAADCVPSTLRVSVASDGSQGYYESYNASISADGRFVAFLSWANNLVPGDANTAPDVFVRDTCVGATDCVPSTLRVSVASNGTQANYNSYYASISADGRFVAFDSRASNLVAGDTNNHSDIFLARTGH